VEVITLLIGKMFVLATTLKPTSTPLKLAIPFPTVLNIVVLPLVFALLLLVLQVWTLTILPTPTVPTLAEIRLNVSLLLPTVLSTKSIA